MSLLRCLPSTLQWRAPQQLARLRFDQLVETRREGRMIYYSLASAEVAPVIETLYGLFCAPVRGSEANAAE